MSNVILLAVEIGAAVFGSSGIVGGLAIAVKTKSDYKTAFAKLEQDGQKLREDGERADRKQDSEDDKRRYEELHTLYANACGERDRFERLYKEARTESEVLRLMWDQFDTTLDDVIEREKARHRRLFRGRDFDRDF